MSGEDAASAAGQSLSGGPCRYCLAAYPILFEEGDTTSCEWEHRDDPRVETDEALGGRAARDQGGNSELDYEGK